MFATEVFVQRFCRDFLSRQLVVAQIIFNLLEVTDYGQVELWIAIFCQPNGMLPALQCIVLKRSSKWRVERKNLQ